MSYGLHKLNKDYGKGLAKLVKKENKSTDDGSSISVSHRACLTQLTVLAGKHKQIAVSLGNLSKEYETHIKRLLDQHKCVETEAKKLQSDLDNNIRKLDRSREKFEKRQNEADNAEDHLTKAEPDSRADMSEFLVLRPKIGQLSPILCCHWLVRIEIMSISEFQELNWRK